MRQIKKRILNFNKKKQQHNVHCDYSILQVYVIVYYGIQTCKLKQTDYLEEKEKQYLIKRTQRTGSIAAKRGRSRDNDMGKIAFNSIVMVCTERKTI